MDDEALAAASLAQVHRATLVTGETVAVKIQYPEARRLFPADLKSLRFAARVARWLNPGLRLGPLINDLARFVELELDFSREAASMDRVRAAIGDAPHLQVAIPRVFRQHSTGRLLVLEFMEGTPLSRLDTEGLSAEERARLAERIAALYVWMIFDLGFFHGDPHPGNILVHADGRLALLDFGLARELPDGFADGMARLIVCGMRRDAPAALAAAKDIGFEIGGKKPEEFIELVRLLLGDYRSRHRLVDVVRVASLDAVPPHFALIVRVFILLNGLSERLVPGQRVIMTAMMKALGPRLLRAGQMQADGV
jgi:ubiquinone biosynthesis protein